jgi:hypothetical protein
MATVYKIELTSHWTNYTKEQLQALLTSCVERDEELNKHGNEITLEVLERS